VIFNQRHLRHVLSSYVDYYQRTRTHLSPARIARKPASDPTPGVEKSRRHPASRRPPSPLRTSRRLIRNSSCSPMVASRPICEVGSGQEAPVYGEDDSLICRGRSAQPFSLWIFQSCRGEPRADMGPKKYRATRRPLRIRYGRMSYTPGPPSAGAQSLSATQLPDISKRLAMSGQGSCHRSSLRAPASVCDMRP